MFSTVLAWLVSHEAARIHEHTRTAHQVYQKADDAISDIQANINKGALIDQSGFSNPDSVETRKRISDLQQITKNDCATLIDLIGASQRSQSRALEHGLDSYWGSIQKSLSTARSRTRSGWFSSSLKRICCSCCVLAVLRLF